MTISVQSITELVKERKNLDVENTLLRLSSTLVLTGM